MVSSELIKKSPLRILDSTMGGGLGKGNIGVLASRHGLGKTSALVHLATDKLLQGKHVVHVTFATRTSHILEYYEEIFAEVSKVKDLTGARDVQNEIAPRRTVMNFNQQGMRTSHVLESLKSRIEDGGFPAELIIVDEFDFAQAHSSDLSEFRRFAARESLEVWFSVSLEGESENSTKPIPPILEKFLKEIDVLINLRHHRLDEKVHLELVKDHSGKPQDTRLVLDSKTLLISPE